MTDKLERRRGPFDWDEAFRQNPDLPVYEIPPEWRMPRRQPPEQPPDPGLLPAVTDALTDALTGPIVGLRQMLQAGGDTLGLEGA